MKGIQAAVMKKYQTFVGNQETENKIEYSQMVS